MPSMSQLSAPFHESVCERATLKSAMRSWSSKTRFGCMPSVPVSNTTLPSSRLAPVTSHFEPSSVAVKSLTTNPSPSAIGVGLPPDGATLYSLDVSPSVVMK
jgi:hypothetical protein